MKIPFSRIAISLLRISSPSHIQRRSFTSTNLNSLNLTTISRGELGTLEYKLNYEKNGKEISPWHDIPLKNENNYNFITEIPRLSTSKMEISTKEEYNPITQDSKNNKPRHYAGPIYWNYGCFPQTWEDPNEKNAELNAFGDNDPLDVIEISSRSLPLGSVTPVKVLGVFAMLDGGELDWKVLAINRDDPLYNELNDVDDVEKKLPGYISGIREWFRWYKIPDGKPLNSFGYDEKCLSKHHALHVINETHEAWKRLVFSNQSKGKLWIGNKNK